MFRDSTLEMIKRGEGIPREIPEEKPKGKRYFYKGQEISKRKANAMAYGALAGMIGAGFGLWILTIFLSALFQAAGGAA